MSALTPFIHKQYQRDTIQQQPSSNGQYQPTGGAAAAAVGQMAIQAITTSFGAQLTENGIRIGQLEIALQNEQKEYQKEKTQIEEMHQQALQRKETELGDCKSEIQRLRNQRNMVMIGAGGVIGGIGLAAAIVRPSGDRSCLIS